MDGPLQIQNAKAPSGVWQYESIASARQRTPSQMETSWGIQSTNCCTLFGQTGEKALQGDCPAQGNGEPCLDLNFVGNIWDILGPF